MHAVHVTTSSEGDEGVPGTMPRKVIRKYGIQNTIYAYP
jgi:hypothetical protein